MRTAKKSTNKELTAKWDSCINKNTSYKPLTDLSKERIDKIEAFLDRLRERIGRDDIIVAVSAAHANRRIVAVRADIQRNSCTGNIIGGCECYSVWGDESVFDEYYFGCIYNHSFGICGSYMIENDDV